LQKQKNAASNQRLIEVASQRLQIGRIGADDCEHGKDDTGARARTKMIRRLALDFHFGGLRAARLLFAGFGIVEIILQFEAEIPGVGRETKRGLEID
jgi:hypothetical protein